jgi:hypothetical protein
MCDQCSQFLVSTVDFTVRGERTGSQESHVLVAREACQRAVDRGDGVLGTPAEQRGDALVIRVKGDRCVE